MNKLSDHLKDPITMILLVLVVLSLMSTWSYMKETPGLDYYVAWVAADSVNSGSSLNIYERESAYKLRVLYRNKADEASDAPRQKRIAKHRKGLPMTATPFMYWVTGMLSSGDYERDLSLWHAISLLLITASVLVSCRIMGYTVATSLAILIPVLTLMAPFHSDIRVANVNSFQLGLIALILWLQSLGNDTRCLFATGLVIGLLAMFKPNLAPVAVLLTGGWLVRGQISKMLTTIYGIATGALAAVFVSSWWMSNATVWLDWLKVLSHVVSGSPGKGGGNYSVMTQVSGGMTPPGQLTLAIVYCLLCLACLWWGRRRLAASADDKHDRGRESLENTLLIAMGGIVALLASSLVWVHYYLLATPMIIFALRPWNMNDAMRAVPILMLRVLPLIALLALLESDLSTLLAELTKSKSYWAMATMTSAITLFLVGLWQFVYGIRDRR